MPVTEAVREKLPKKHIRPTNKPYFLSFTSPVQKLPSIILPPGRLSAGEPPSLLVSDNVLLFLITFNRRSSQETSRPNGKFIYET